MDEESEVFVVHVRKFDFDPEDKVLDDNCCIPNVKLSSGYADLAFSSEKAADNYVDGLIGTKLDEINPDLCWNEWIKVEQGDTIWYFYYEEPYPLDQNIVIDKEKLI